MARGLVGGGLEAFVAVAARAALGDDDGLAGADVGQDFAVFFVDDHRAGGDADDPVIGVGTGALLGAAGLAVLGGPLVDAAEVDQGVETLVGGQDDIAALAAVTAVGTALGDVFGALERQLAVAALAGPDHDACAVYKHAGF